MQILTLFDLVALAVILAVLPIVGSLDWRRFQARCRAGRQPSRLRLYASTMAQAWIVALLILAGHLAAGRSPATLGIAMPAGSGLLWATAAVAMLTGLLIWSLKAARHAGTQERETICQSLGPMAEFMPSSRTEKRAWLALSLTSGITEELVYRGYLFWLLALLLPTIWAAVAACLIFGLQHAYMGVGGVARTALLGALLTGLYWLTGSLLLPMIAHALINLIQGLTFAGIGDDASAGGRP